MYGKSKRWEYLLLSVGIITFVLFLVVPEISNPWATLISNANHWSYRDSSPLHIWLGVMGQGLTRTTSDYWATLKYTSLTLRGRGLSSDIAQDIIGFRALINQKNPYPILGPAYQEMGLEWDVKHASSHPPTAFLFFAPIAFLPWSWASMIWAWLMIICLLLTARCYEVSWKTAIGLIPFILLWPPVMTSLGQLTPIWLLAISIEYRFSTKREFWRGISIGLASLTKFFPGIMTLSFLVKRQWRALLGFALTWIVSLMTLFLLYPSAIYRYIEVNQTNAQDMILRMDNSSLIYNSYRFGGWCGVSLILTLFLLIIWVNRDCFYIAKLSSSPKLWMILTYFSVVLLPVFWIYSLTPLLPIILFMIKRRTWATKVLGSCAIVIPFLIPPFGSVTIFPLILVQLLVGIGLLISANPDKALVKEV